VSRTVARSAAFVKAGGIEIDFPELDDNVVESTFGAQPKVRFSSPTGLDYGHRWALRGWLEQTAALYAEIGEKVKPEPVSA
jgi:hypothetical protein